MVGKRLKSLFSFIEAFCFCKGRKQLKHGSSEQAVVARHCRQRLLGVMACVVRSVCCVVTQCNTGEHSLIHNLFDFEFVLGSFYTLRNL